MTYADVTHPLDEALANLAGEDKKVADTMASLDQLVDSGWFFASDLLDDEYTLEELLNETGRYWKTDWRFLQASLLLPYYIVPAVSAAIYGLYAGNRVLDVSARNFAVQLDESGQIADAAFTSRRFGVLESDPAAAHPDAIPLPDRASLVAWMFDRMIEHHLRPLFSHIRAQTKLGQNVMWASAAYGCVVPLMGLQRAGFFTVEEVLAEKTALLDNGPRQLRDRLTIYPLTSGEHQALFMRIRCAARSTITPIWASAVSVRSGPARSSGRCSSITSIATLPNSSLRAAPLLSLPAHRKSLWRSHGDNPCGWPYCS